MFEREGEGTASGTRVKGTAGTWLRSECQLRGKRDGVAGPQGGSLRLRNRYLKTNGKRRSGAGAKRGEQVFEDRRNHIVDGRGRRFNTRRGEKILDVESR